MKVERKANITQNGVVITFEVEGCTTACTMANLLCSKMLSLEHDYVENEINKLIEQINNKEFIIEQRHNAFIWLIPKEKHDVRLITRLFLKELKGLINKLDNENKKKGLAEWLIPEMEFKI